MARQGLLIPLLCLPPPTGEAGRFPSLDRNYTKGETMAVLLITYDLQKPGQDYSELLSKIKSYTWVRLSESSYAIRTDSTPSTVFDYLKPYLDSNDNLYVITLKQPYAGYGPKEVNSWLNNNLTY